MKFSRYWAMPNKWTFEIKPIKELLKRYNVGKGWVDPFCGNSSLCEYRNDIDKNNENTKYHFEAEEFCNKLKDNYFGVVLDPQYSNRQISEHYKSIGIKVSKLHTSTNFYSKVKNAIYNKVDMCISFGWNSNGLGKKRGFKIIEIMLIAHGGQHNDTIITVEEKIRQGTIINEI